VPRVLPAVADDQLPRLELRDVGMNSACNRARARPRAAEWRDRDAARHGAADPGAAPKGAS
jgi:hypothetical protein